MRDAPRALRTCRRARRWERAEWRAKGDGWSGVRARLCPLPAPPSPTPGGPQSRPPDSMACRTASKGGVRKRDQKKGDGQRGASGRWAEGCAGRVRGVIARENLGQEKGDAGSKMRKTGEPGSKRENLRESRELGSKREIGGVKERTCVEGEKGIGGRKRGRGETKAGK
eukprot:6184562-Pleurochrysis_carterae.AAC.2